MIGAIGSSTSYSTIGTGPSPAALQSQLVKYQKELSDCVNCSSAKTPEGKAKIEEITGKISDINARIEKTVTPSSSGQSAAFNAKKLPDITADQSRSTQTTVPNKNHSGSVSDPSAFLIGSRLDVFV